MCKVKNKYETIYKDLISRPIEDIIEIYNAYGAANLRDTYIIPMSEIGKKLSFKKLSTRSIIAMVLDGFINVNTNDNYLVKNIHEEFFSFSHKKEIYPFLNNPELLQWIFHAYSGSIDNVLNSLENQ